MKKEEKEQQIFQDGFEVGMLEQSLKDGKEVNKIIKWLQGIVWCNGHDKAWIEKTIEKLEKLKSKEVNKC